MKDGKKYVFNFCIVFYGIFFLEMYIIVLYEKLMERFKNEIKRVKLNFVKVIEVLGDNLDLFVSLGDMMFD